MGVVVSLGRIGMNVLEEIERGEAAARAVALDGAPRERVAGAELAIAFATADGSDAPSAVFPAEGPARPPWEARAWLEGLAVPVVVAAKDIAAREARAQGRLILRVDFTVPTSRQGQAAS